ncbi:MAG TPA: kynureninase [Draconibacterium sp.]|nr:kynureninase [Draconibacterium sp.]
MIFHFETNRNFAQKLDEQDNLKHFRERFFFADNTIYLDGNSLGRLPMKTKSFLQNVVENQWGTELIESWNKHWYEKSEELGNKIAKIIGASEGEVIITDSTSVNLYKLTHAALKFQTGRTRVVSDVFNFPTDLYILQGILKEFDSKYELVLASSKDEITIDLADLKKNINEKTALVELSLVSFKSSFLYNAEKITALAHKKGALVLWDLSHAAGAVPVELNKTNADLAVGCTYKYLNGGPGAPSFLYVKKELQTKLTSPIQGWFGDDRPFAFDLNYKPATGIRKFLAGTPPVISQLAIEPGIDILMEAGMKKIRKKSILLTEYFIFLARYFLFELKFSLGSPDDYRQRGSHISLKHVEGYRICLSLTHPKNNSERIVSDFREPDNIRFGFVPQYTSFTEVWLTVQRLKEIVQTKEFELHSKVKKGVT